jgi:hypothetical protein
VGRVRVVGELFGLSHYVAHLGGGDDQSEILGVLAADRRTAGAQVAEGAGHTQRPGLVLPVPRR